MIRQIAPRLWIVGDAGYILALGVTTRVENPMVIEIEISEPSVASIETCSAKDERRHAFCLARSRGKVRLIDANTALFQNLRKLVGLSWPDHHILLSAVTAVKHPIVCHAKSPENK